jgi:putative membrane protein
MTFEPVMHGIPCSDARRALVRYLMFFQRDSVAKLFAERHRAKARAVSSRNSPITVIARNRVWCGGLVFAGRAAMKAITTVLFMALLSTSAYADDAAKHDTTTTDTAKPAKKEKLTTAELQVLAHYHAVNLLEIDLGKTAMKKGSTQAVKSYGEMLVKDHGDSDKKMKDLAKATKQIIPAEKAATDAEKQEKADQKKQVAALKKMKGADFDRQYLQMMVDGHDKELAKIDTKIGEVQNSELADMLRAKKPVLQHHADQARELQNNNAQASTTTTAPTTAKK